MSTTQKFEKYPPGMHRAKKRRGFIARLLAFLGLFDFTKLEMRRSDKPGRPVL